jgi:hypothetical protein
MAKKKETQQQPASEPEQIVVESWDAKDGSHIVLVKDAPPSILTLMLDLGNRIGTVMSETRKRPGELLALQQTLQNVQTNMGEHPLLTYRGKTNG